MVCIAATRCRTMPLPQDADDEDDEEGAVIDGTDPPPRVAVALTVLFSEKDAPIHVHAAACHALVRYLLGEVDG